MFCNQCGARIADGSVFCNLCGTKQGVVATPAVATGPPMIIDEVLPDREEICQDPRYGNFSKGQLIHLRAKVESGGPYDLWVIDDSQEILKVFKGIITDNTFEYVVPREGEFGFDFQSTGQPGAVRLQVY